MNRVFSVICGLLLLLSPAFCVAATTVDGDPLIQGKAANIVGPVYNVLNYGAVVNDGNSDSTAIQAAITAIAASGVAGATLFFPAGQYDLTASIVIDASYISIIGAGRSYTRLVRKTNYGNTFTIGSVGVNYAINIRDIWFIHSSENNVDMTSGAHVFLKDISGSVIENCCFTNGYYGIEIQGGTTHKIDNCEIYAYSTYATATKAGIKVGNCAGCDLDIGYLVYISNLEIQGGTTSMDYGLWFEKIDTVMMSNVYTGNIKTYHIYIDSSTYPNTALFVSNLYCDTHTGKHVYAGGGQYAGTISFRGCLFRDTIGSVSVDMDAGDMGEINFIGCSFNSNYGNALKIGSNVAGANIIGNTFAWNDINASGTDYDIVIEGGASKVNITGNTFMKGASTGGPVELQSGATSYVNISDNVYSLAGVATVLDSGVTGADVTVRYANGSLLYKTDNYTMKATDHDYIIYMGATGKTITLPNPTLAAYKRYTIFFGANGTLNIDPGAGINIAGATDANGDRLQATVYGSTITLIAGSGNWLVGSMYKTWTDIN